MERISDTENSRWQTIWSSKEVVSRDSVKSQFERFCELKKANGFDEAVENEEEYYRHFYNSWFELYENVERLVEDDIKSVFEVGCGSGVNLFMFKSRITQIALGG